MQKPSLFSGIFKKSHKSAEPSIHTQNSLSKTEFSKSSDSLTDSSTTEKGGVFKGMFKKTTKSSKEAPVQDSLTSANPGLSASSENITDNKSSKEKSGVFGGILKRSPKPGHVRRASQDFLEIEFPPGINALPEKNTTKESGGLISGIKKTFGGRTQSQDDLSAPRELSGSTDNLSVNSGTKETGGIFSGVFRKSPKSNGLRTQSQDDLSAHGELSDSSDYLSESGGTKEKGGFFSGVFRKKVSKSPSQDDLSVEGKRSASSNNLIEWSSKEKVKSEQSGGSKDSSSTTKKLEVKQESFSATRSTFYTDKQKDSGSDSEETSENGENHPSHKPSKFAEAMTKLNPFRYGNKNEKPAASEDELLVSSDTSAKKKKDNKDPESVKNDETPAGEKPNVVKSKMNQREKKERSETPQIPPRPADEEMKQTSTYSKAQPRGTEDKPNQSDDEGIKNEDSEAKRPESTTTRLKKSKGPNPFLQRTLAKAPSDDEGLKDEDDSAAQEEKKDESKDTTEETKVKKPKRFNPFMPRVKAKIVQKKEEDESNAEENEGANRSLFDQLEDFRIGPAESEDGEAVENLMDWWNSVESWEDTPQDDDMTEKEEAKAFAVTAERVQKGIRVFNKLFSERAESLWQHVIDLNSIADGLDKFSKNTKIAQITGGSTSAIGGVATIAGLALAPVTFGTSLIVTAVGLGVATAGGLTSAGAGISNQVNNSMDRKKVEKIVQDYQEKMVDLNKCLKFIKQGIENLKKFDLIKMKKHAYNRDFPVLSSSFYEDGAMAGKAILINANEIMRVVQIANVAGSTAARAVQIASMATGVLTGLFVGMDIYFVAKDSKELKKGAKSEFAAKIREVATQLHDGLVELNTIREELQSTTPEGNDGANETAALDGEKKEKDHKYDSSDEDEIDRIKKAIKKDIESRDFV
ncbi:apolipoprotein L1 isoform X2 [Antennarius striatus]|uniref:apolipoprotein L1 isoform X2 n=1 Tax=Antennarius striatus TaxID=241820 RepID=UPI0035AE846D